MEKIYLLFAAAGGALFAEMSLRSWRLLAQIIFSRRAQTKENGAPTAPVSEGQQGAPIAVRGRAPVIRFLLLKATALAVPVALFLMLRGQIGKQDTIGAVLAFAGVYLLYLFVRAWSLKDSGIHTVPPS